MIPFLRQIAAAYNEAAAGSLVDYTFVFPNKRAATFFQSHLTDMLPENTIFPELTDIDTLVKETTRSIFPSKTEMLFVLFNIYRNLVEELGGDSSALAIETFIPWGEMVLNDFNEVDLYLVDPEEIFRNVKHFRNISANFLTEEQAALIEKYWGGEKKEFWNDERLWRHLDPPNLPQETKQNFFRLWFMMYPLYIRFREELKKRDRAYPGMAYRRFAEMTKHDEDFNRRFDGKKFVFVGFSQLNKAQEVLFSYFRRSHSASFFWDMAGLALNDEINPAGKKIAGYAKEFPADPDIKLHPDNAPDHFPEVEIIGVPSRYGMVKKGTYILENLLETYPDDFKDSKARRTAFVLPEESLLLPLLDSLPDKKNPNLKPGNEAEDLENVLNVNITMAFPLKNSAFFSLFKLLMRLENNARTIESAERGFFYKDVLAILAHPVIRNSFSPLCTRLLTEINRNRMVMIGRQWLMKNAAELAGLFPAAETFGVTDEFDVVREMLLTMRSMTVGETVESAFAAAYLRGLDLLEKLSEQYGVMLDRQMIMSQLYRVVSSDTAHFSGEPLQGIQIMGMLETRALDFENLIILGVNEGVFPKKQMIRSFIPMELRNGYGLPVTEDAENALAYYFYRLLSRTKRVFLIYDARTASGNERSRFIYQLLYIYGRRAEARIRHHIDFYSLSTSESRPISIKKDAPWIKERLNLYRTPESGKYLSASSINDFIACGLKFFLKNIAGFAIDNDFKHFLDESQTGNVVHKALENIYDHFSESNPNFNSERINRILGQHGSMIVRETVRAIRKEMANLNDKEAKELPAHLLDPDSLNGENRIMLDIMVEMVRNTMLAEARSKDFNTFVYDSGEKEIKGTFNLPSGLSFNLRGFIDRVDRVLLPGQSGQLLRFVDYKTGKDKTSFTKLDELFDRNINDRRKAILQLLLYCHAYAQTELYNEPIIPQIFPVRNLKKGELDFMKYGKTDISDYHSIEGFMEKLDSVVQDIFSGESTFDATPSDENCKYCHFKEICGVK